jgi:hypothetical protein
MNAGFKELFHGDLGHFFSSPVFRLRASAWAFIAAIPHQKQNTKRTD